MSSHQALPLLPSAEATVLATTTRQPHGPMLSSGHKLHSELLRLHRFYGHSPGLLDLLRRASQYTPEVRSILDDIVANCSTCLSTGRPAPRPRTCLPMTWDLNGVVAVDIFYVANIGVLHIIDVATRFNAAAVLRRGKCSSEIIRALETHWISLLGYPLTLFADDTTETKSVEFLAYCALHNIGVNLTAAQSQFANGICERHGGVLQQTIDRLLHDSPAATLESLVEKSVLIHNSMASVDGSSPLRRLCGVDPRLPSILSDTPASLCPFTLSQVPGDGSDRLQQLQAARTAFSAAQSSRSLKIALASKLHPYTDAVFNLDDKVYFWTPPGTSSLAAGRPWRLGKVAGSHMRHESSPSFMVIGSTCAIRDVFVVSESARGSTGCRGPNRSDSTPESS